MTSPTEDVQIPATNTNWSAGPLINTVTKTIITAGQLADGIIGGQSIKSRLVNYILNTNARWLEFLRSEGGTAIYGDGNDGLLMPIGTATLIEDRYSTDVTLDGADVIESDGYRLFCNGTLTMGATTIVRNNGSDASGTTAGNGAEARGSAPTVRALLGGGDGEPGPIGNNAPGTQASALLFRQGGAGGAGGADGTGNAGGAAQPGSLFSPVRGGFRHWPRIVDRQVQRNSDGSFLQLGGGVGGSSGANDVAGGGQHGGAGGGGGGVVIICARRIVLAAGAIIEANGGAGSAGTGVTDPAGGGGGGGGGVVVLITRELQDSGATIQALGGAGGAAGAFGGAAGLAGDAGEVFLLTG